MDTRNNLDSTKAKRRILGIEPGIHIILPQPNEVMPSEIHEAFKQSGAEEPVTITPSALLCFYVSTNPGDRQQRV